MCSGTSPRVLIGIVMAKRLWVSMNVRMWRCPPVDVGVMGPMVSLDTVWPGCVAFGTAGSCVLWWALPDAHAEHVILSVGFG